MGWLPVPKGSKASYFIDYIDLPVTDHFCWALKSEETNEETEVDNSNSETQNDNATKCNNDEDGLDDTVQCNDIFKQFKSLIQDTESLREILT